MLNLSRLGYVFSMRNFQSRHHARRYSKVASTSGESRSTSSELEKKAKKAYHLLQFEEALDFCHKAIERNPNRVPYFILRGKVYYKLKDYEMALADLRRAILMEPKENSARKLICSILLELGRLDEARAHIQHIDTYRLGTMGNAFYFVNQFEQAIFCYNAAIERSPSHAWLLRLRGNCFLSMEKYDESVSDFQKALSSTPDNEDIGNLLIKALLLSGRVNEALQRMINLKHVCTAFIGYTLFFERKFKEALLCFTDAIKKDASKPWYHKYRGLCHLNMGNSDEAISEFRNTLRLEPLNEDAQILLCEALLNSDRMEEAKEEIRAASDTSIWLFKLGKQFRQENKLEKAIRWYSALIEVSPGNSAYYIERARCHREMGHTAEAKADCESGIRLVPHEMTDRLKLVQVFLDSEALDAARSVIENIDVNKLSEKDYDRLQNLCYQIDYKENRTPSVAELINSESQTENAEVVQAFQTDERMQE